MLIGKKSLKVPSHESYTQRRAPPHARLPTSRRSAPFLPHLGLLSIPPCFLCCNASYPFLRVYRPHLVRCPAQFAVLCRSSCSCLDVNTREKGKLCGVTDKVWPIQALCWVRSVTKQETGRDTQQT